LGGNHAHDKSSTDEKDVVFTLCAVVSYRRVFFPLLEINLTKVMFWDGCAGGMLKSRDRKA